MAKEFAKSFYASKAWHDVRDAYIASVGGLCEDCLARGKYNPGKVVHHIKPLSPANINDASITMSFANLRFVCQDCHADEHRGDIARRYRFDDAGNIVER